MRTRNLLTASVLGTGLVFGSLAVTASAALAATVEGKISSVSAAQKSFMMNKKTYRVSDTAKILVLGKPGSLADLKSGMRCSATVAHAVEAQALTCTK
jgi:hypothetical protein